MQTQEKRLGLLRPRSCRSLTESVLRISNCVAGQCRAHIALAETRELAREPLVEQARFLEGRRIRRRKLDVARLETLCLSAPYRR
jgi:hypothetical protein